MGVGCAGPQRSPCPCLPRVNQKRWGVSVMCPKQGHPEKVFLFTLLDPSRSFVLLFKTVSCVAHVGIELAK